MRVKSIIERLRSHFAAHPAGGTIAKLTKAIGASYEGRVEGELHRLLKRGEVTRFVREVVDFNAVYHYRLPTEQAILTLIGD